MNLCYIFSCERRPPNEEEMKGLKDQAKKQSEKLKKQNDGKPEVSYAKPEDGSKIDPDEKLIPTPRLERKDSMIITEPAGGTFGEPEIKVN